MGTSRQSLTLYQLVAGGSGVVESGGTGWATVKGCGHGDRLGHKPSEPRTPQRLFPIITFPSDLVVL